MKPLNIHHQFLPVDPHSSCFSVLSPPELVQFPDSDGIRGALKSSSTPDRTLKNHVTDNSLELQLTLCGYVDRLKREAGGGGEGDGVESDAGRWRGLDRSSYHHAIAALENTSEEEDEDELEFKRRTVKKSTFQRPVVETESTFRPTDFGSRLLPAENKPLEMVVLKRAKELLLRHDHHSIARHLLMADCQVKN